MSELDDQFQAAVDGVTALAKDPGNEAKLRLYGLFKQATVGDAQGGRPGFTNPVGRAKYDAWSAVKGTGADDAKRTYIALAEHLRAHP